MQNNMKILCYGILCWLLLAACRETNSDSGNQDLAMAKDNIKTPQELIADSIELARADSLRQQNKLQQKQKLELAIINAEKDFFKSLKAVDKDFYERNYSKMQRLLKKHDASPYSLYLELTEIFKKSQKEAKQKAVSHGLRESKYTSYIGKIEDGYVKEFQAKYGMDNRLYICFKHNYCSCLGQNSDKYCSGGEVILPNAEFWD